MLARSMLLLEAALSVVGDMRYSSRKTIRISALDRTLYVIFHCSTRRHGPKSVTSCLGQRAAQETGAHVGECTSGRSCQMFYFGLERGQVLD